MKKKKKETDIYNKWMILHSQAVRSIVARVTGKVFASVQRNNFGRYGIDFGARHFHGSKFIVAVRVAAVNHAPGVRRCLRIKSPNLASKLLTSQLHDRIAWPGSSDLWDFFRGLSLYVFRVNVLRTSRGGCSSSRTIEFSRFSTRSTILRQRVTHAVQQSQVLILDLCRDSLTFPTNYTAINVE